MGIVIRELRVRYELKTAMGNTAIHAIVCRFPLLKPYADKIKDAGYKIIGIDERLRNKDVWMPLSRNWKEASTTKHSD